MTVAEFIEWLKTQDQSRVVKVLVKNNQEYYDTYNWQDFNPVLHSSSYYGGMLEIGSDD